ncbi:virulence factor Mce family protein [Mycobacterium shimoidei]|uniref:Mce-family protein Mce1B [Mycobacterium tuberculosis H37Rv] n=1 Tax=Mycobacterium shimoidei TaxID=29313 RepID=A0A1E3TGX9_MYCSH|nr:virulence factor Mce family protein [Mycobacterium shimoidei]MCV7261049.1 virulence factor Mce family protein [Mycobacterium shimoidei]ODR13635.1 mammalian cell entry protein [Mycobacterium shimoidei]ORW76452.1 mammalian cell entry protein [Mycobacterium shimoidei]SRX93647.1 Mce-family protein Mce1B [Mycobacterium tuberculosis H37Rv] [Mycobacterium shimoidei]
MKLTGTVIRLAVIASVQLLLTAVIVVVFGQIRFDRTDSYSAEFSNASGLRAGQFVRASGVEVGKVKRVDLVDDDKRIHVEFAVDRSVKLYQSTTASIRYQDLIGNRYLELERGEGEGADRILPPGGFIPLSRTQPALDLDALIGGFKPLFRALNPDKVNSIASSIIAVFQGEGGTINDILDQTAQLTEHLAERDAAIGEVITNLNTVLDTTVKHRKDFDATVDNFEKLITGLKNRADPLADGTAHISNAAGTVADLLADNRNLLHDTVSRLEVIAQPLVDQRGKLEDMLAGLPDAFNRIGRASGIYGDFFNFYLCDLSLTVNGLQPGGPIRTVKLFTQPTGRCTRQ